MYQPDNPSLLKDVYEYVRDREATPCTEFRVTRGFWVRLPYSKAVTAMHKGELGRYLTAVVSSLRWAAHARGYQLDGVVASSEPVTFDFSVCASSVSELPSSVGWDSEGRPCEEWPRDA